MGALWQDLKYAARMLRKNPGFTAVAILTLALGIGANTAIFSVVNGVVLNPLPYPEPSQLFALYSRNVKFETSSVSYPNFLDWQRQNRTFASLAGYRSDAFNLTGSGEAESVTGVMISADFFPLLGVKPIAGRTFTPNDDHAGAAPVVILSEGFWKRKFGGSTAMLGQAIELNGVAYTVVGIIPETFYFRGNNFWLSDAYLPIGLWTDPQFLNRSVSMGMDVVGRLKPRVTPEQARADMSRIAAGLAREYPDADKDTDITMVPLKEDFVGRVRRILYLLLGAVGFVLLISCVNTANLLLARATGRAREFAVRAALGAERGRIIRQLLTESAILGLMGGALGLLIAVWGTEAAIPILPSSLPRTSQIRPDAHVLAFTMIVSLLAGALFGLAPVLKIRRSDIRDVLQEGARGSTGSRHRLQSVLVVAEIALALVLLVGAGLMVRSLMEVWDVNPGFNPRNVVSFNVSPPPALIGAVNPEAVRDHIRQMDATLQAIPGVQAASSFWGSLPMQGDSELPFWFPWQSKPAGNNDMNQALFYLVKPNYLEAMGIPLERGRFVSEQDTAHSPLVVVIDEQFARAFFGGRDPIGQRINIGIFLVQAEIVGVVGHVKHWGLDSDTRARLQAQMYLPLEQLPDRFVPLTSRNVVFVMRTRGDPGAVVNSVRRELERQDSGQVVWGIETMDQVISRSVATRRFVVILLGAFAGLALLLSCIGIYGVISYVAAQRTHEIGIRMALGAQKNDVLRMLLGQGARLALIGVSVGICTALGLAQLMTNILFGVTTHDPITFAGVAVLLIAVAVLACYIPARRTMRVDPMIALRHE